jgi:HEPN domain-containing protein
MSVPERDALEWLRRAESDLLNIRNNMQAARIPWDTVVFHAQQVCEKLLKAFVVNSGHSAPRTHDLALLLNMCPRIASQDPSSAVDMDKLMLLFGSRYPDTTWPTDVEARAAVQVVEKMMQIVVPLIGTQP